MINVIRITTNNKDFYTYKVNVSKLKFEYINEIVINYDCHEVIIIYDNREDSEIVKECNVFIDGITYAKSILIESKLKNNVRNLSLEKLDGDLIIEMEIDQWEEN